MKLRVFKCPECGADLEVDDKMESCYCMYCGRKIIIDREKQEFTVNKNVNYTKNVNQSKRYTNEAEVIRAKNEDKRSKRDSRQTIIILIIAVLLIFAPISIWFGIDYYKESVAVKNGKISAGYYKDLIGEDYETVQATLEGAGFTNIELIDLNDSGVTFWKKGKVKTISIGGDTDFESNDWFDPDAKVVISYH